MTSTTAKRTSSRNSVQEALDANKKLQQILTQRAEQLEADLKEADSLLDAASINDTQDDPDSEIGIPGAKKATSLFPLTECLNPASPFYEEAIKRSNYLTNTNVHPMKEKDLEVLADAVRRENQRLQAYKSRTQSSRSIADTIINLDNNVEGLDWTRIAERVSDASSVKRTATDCRVCWIGDRHPRINHSEWAAPELSGLLSQVLEEKGMVDWVEVAKQLGTNRTPLDCLRHGLPRQRHSWTPDQDQRLIDIVRSCGIRNWQLVARNVSPHVTAAQCQNRWCKSLDPTLRRGSWTEEEDDRLRKAVAGYGSSWIQVASAIPGRTNDQCRERWHEHLNLSAEKTAWTEAEDKILLEEVKVIGNRWKTISLMIGNNRTGPACRLRYDKLMRSQNTRNSATPRLFDTGLQLVSTAEDASSITQAQSCSPSVEVALRAVVPKPQPKPRTIGKGKAKETIIEHEVSTTTESQIARNGPPIVVTAPKPVLKPRPITRAKGKSAGAETAPPISPETVPVSCASSEIMTNTPRRGSKRDINTEIYETSVPKKRKTQAPKPGSIPASTAVNPTIASASMSFTQSTDGTSPAADADEIMETEPNPEPTAKRTLRERKIAIPIPIKRSRRQSRK